MIAILAVAAACVAISDGQGNTTVTCPLLVTFASFFIVALPFPYFSTSLLTFPFHWTRETAMKCGATGKREEEEQGKSRRTGKSICKWKC